MQTIARNTQYFQFYEARRFTKSMVTEECRISGTIADVGVLESNIIKTGKNNDSITLR